MSCYVKPAAGSSYLSDHSVPNASDQLAVLAVGDQVEVIGKLYGAGQLFQDIDAEALTAQFCVWLGMTDDPKRQREEKTENVMVLMTTNSKTHRYWGRLILRGFIWSSTVSFLLCCFENCFFYIIEFLLICTAQLSLL